MKFFKNILCVLLVSAVLNTVVTKALHEFFEHHHEIHTCFNKDIIHFHDFDAQHLDLICDFNLSSTLLTGWAYELKNQVNKFDNYINVGYSFFLRELFHNYFFLRGPPIIK